MKTVAPEWAAKLTEQVCSDYKRGLPGLLTWKIIKRQYSNGHTSYARWAHGGVRYIYKIGQKPKRFYGEVYVAAGVKEEDQRLVLLHELAHWVAGKGKPQGHTNKFWDTAFELYERYGIDREYAFNREKNYKKGAVTAYERRYKPTDENS